MTDNLEDRLKENYFNNGSFKHRTGKLIKIFPFVTTSIAGSVVRELDVYTGLCGEVSRRIASLKKTLPFGSEELRSALQEKVETNKLDTLLDILKSLAFDDQEMVVPYSISAYPYLDFTKEKPVLKEISLFLYEVLWGGLPEESIYCDFFNNKDNNIMHSLLHDCFPKLQPDTQTPSSKYTKLNIGLEDVFLEDWKFLSSHAEYFQSHFHLFLKLYCFLSLIRTVEVLNLQYEEKPLDPIFFTLEWESCSKGRIAYQRGWKRLEGQVSQIFSHANTLELLNHINLLGLKSPFTYVDFKQWCKTADSFQKEKALEALELTISFYRKSVTPRGGWEMYEPLEYRNCEYDVLSKASLLFKMVDCQFRYSQRNAPAKRYSNWLYQSSVNNFCRIRGRIGRTLAFSKDHILFLTRLAIGDKEKLRLHEYWSELERRGIAFDFESRRKIVDLFEQINILEKKSDSGDAQYVRAII